MQTEMQSHHTCEISLDLLLNYKQCKAAIKYSTTNQVTKKCFEAYNFFAFFWLLHMF